MLRVLVIFLSVIIFSYIPGHFKSARAQGKGTLSVTTTPVSGAIYIDYVFRGAKFWSGDLEIGSHAVSFGEIEGYIAPPLQMVTVIADQTNYVIGAYKKQFALLNIDSYNEYFCCPYPTYINTGQDHTRVSQKPSEKKDRPTSHNF